MLLLFSWPKYLALRGDIGDCEEVELPESGVVDRARFNGLLGDTRARVMREGGAVLVALADRSESLTPGRRGVCVCAGDNCGALAISDEFTVGGADEGGCGIGRCCSGVVASRRLGDFGELSRELAGP